MQANRSDGVDDYDVRIVEAIADREGVRPEELDPPLYEVIDSDALNSLFGNDGDDARVVFTYAGYEVTVSGDGEVSLTPLDA